MNLSEDERAAIVTYRRQKAKDTLKEAEGIARLCYWNAVANRLYYSCYYMVTALLIKRGLSVQTHSGAIRLFGLNYVSPGLVSKDMSKLYTRLFDLRQTGDYDDLYNLSESDVLPLIEPAARFIEQIETLLDA